MKKIEINDKTDILNPLVGVYAIQVNKIYVKDNSSVYVRNETLDLKNFDELKKVTQDLGEQNLRAKEKSKEEKQPYYLQKILVVL